MLASVAHRLTASHSSATTQNFTHTHKYTLLRVFHRIPFLSFTFIITARIRSSAPSLFPTAFLLMLSSFFFSIAFATPNVYYNTIHNRLSYSLGVEGRQQFIQSTLASTPLTIYLANRTKVTYCTHSTHTPSPFIHLNKMVINGFLLTLCPHAHITVLLYCNTTALADI